MGMAVPCLGKMSGYSQRFKANRSAAPAMATSRVFEEFRLVARLNEPASI
jgi:hypothetical protein